MTEKELMRIKRDLQARARKKHMGKARTGAYVYGTLRKIRGNPSALLSKAGFAIVVEDPKSGTLDILKTFDPRNPEAPRVFDSKKDAERYAKWSLNDLQWSVIPITKVLKNRSRIQSNRCWKGYKPVRGKAPYSKGSCMRALQANGGKMKTWKLGEYASGGIIQAKVSQNKNAVAIRVLDYYTKEILAVRLFRWPLDKFNLEMYLNELTTSYYSNVILDWIAKA